MWPDYGSGGCGVYTRHTPHVFLGRRHLGAALLPPSCAHYARCQVELLRGAFSFERRISFVHLIMTSTTALGIIGGPE
jgi:hypothetical protein